MMKLPVTRIEKNGHHEFLNKKEKFTARPIKLMHTTVGLLKVNQTGKGLMMMKLWSKPWAYTALFTGARSRWCMWMAQKPAFSGNPNIGKKTRYLLK